MSEVWQIYVDKNLLGTKMVTSAAICSHFGDLYAVSNHFENGDWKKFIKKLDEKWNDINYWVELSATNKS